MAGSSAHGIVVGIDRSVHADEVLDWAGAEAALRGVPLQIGHSWSQPPHGPAEEREDIDTGAAEAAAEMLRKAQERVRKQYGNLQVDVALMPEGPVAGLIRLGARADLLVVGSRGLSRFASALVGSVAQSLVAHAPCPVVVMRGISERTGTTGGLESWAPTGTTGCAPVVLGAAPGELYAPVEFAFAEAARREVPLLAVRAWRYSPRYGGYGPVHKADMGLRNREEGDELSDVLAEAHESFPGVQVIREVGMNEPAWALIDASSRACLMVVGTERRRHNLALPIGRVAGQVLHNARCPVAVVPHR